ncbi:hypothetical protein LXA43DRAFT_1082644 [Ganoderma leucocontextum]|nr:hypothetical protein LXA43DRAFT_1082644 [Ganoderma leucocontextum]
MSIRLERLRVRREALNARDVGNGINEATRDNAEVDLKDNRHHLHLQATSIVHEDLVSLKIMEDSASGMVAGVEIESDYKRTKARLKRHSGDIQRAERRSSWPSGPPTCSGICPTRSPTKSVGRSGHSEGPRRTRIATDPTGGRASTAAFPVRIFLKVRRRNDPHIVRLGNYRVFPQSTTTCANPRLVNTAHRWTGADISGTLDMPTGGHSTITNNALCVLDGFWLSVLVETDDR